MPNLFQRLSDRFNWGRRRKLDEEIFGQIWLLNLSVIGLIAALFIWGVHEYLTSPQGVSLIVPKVIALFIGTKFLLWPKTKDNLNLAATLAIGAVTVTILAIHYLGGFDSGNLLGVYLIPIFSFLVGGLLNGMVWSLIVLVWIVGLAVLNQLGRSGIPVEVGYILKVIFFYVLVTSLSLTYEKLRDRIEKNFLSKNRELQRLIHVISHDLRTPLTSIKGFVSFMREDMTDPKPDMLKHDIERTEFVISSMEQMINDLLNLSRIGRGQDMVEETNVDELVKRLLIENESQFQGKGITAGTQGAFPTFNTNRRKLEEVFRNLISNAIKYIGSPENPTITIGVQENAFEYQFFVQDNGVGIDPEYHDKVFELFYQQDSNTRSGSGIGLSVVKGFIEDLGGKIWVESTKDQGSTFRFSVPKIHVPGQGKEE